MPTAHRFTSPNKSVPPWATTVMSHAWNFRQAGAGRFANCLRGGILQV